MILDNEVPGIALGHEGAQPIRVNDRLRHDEVLSDRSGSLMELVLRAIGAPPLIGIPIDLGVELALGGTCRWTYPIAPTVNRTIARMSTRY